MKAFATAAAALTATFALALAATDTTPEEAADEIVQAAQEFGEEF